MIPMFLRWPPVPTPIQALPTTCPACGGATPPKEMKAYGRCETCYTEPRVGMPRLEARSKLPVPKK